MSKERRKKKGKGTMLPRCWWSWVLVAGEGRGKFVSKKKKKKSDLRSKTGLSWLVTNTTWVLILTNQFLLLIFQEEEEQEDARHRDAFLTLPSTAFCLPCTALRCPDLTFVPSCAQLGVKAKRVTGFGISSAPPAMSKPSQQTLLGARVNFHFLIYLD